MPITKGTPPAPGRRPVPARPPAQAPRETRAAARERALKDWSTIVTTIMVLRGMYADAGAVDQHGPPLYRDLAQMGDTNERIGKGLDWLAQLDPGAGASFLPLVFQLLANHGKIDAERLPPESGILPPKLLEERVRAQIAEAHAKILREIEDIRKRTIAITAESETQIGAHP